MFQVESNRVFLFSGPTDVQVYSSGQRLDSQRFPGAWALVDSNVGLTHPREELVSTISNLFVVQSTSPQPSRWKEWSKQLGAVLAVMKAWSWMELYIGG